MEADWYAWLGTGEADWMGGSNLFLATWMKNTGRPHLQEIEAFGSLKTWDSLRSTGLTDDICDHLLVLERKRERERESSLIRRFISGDCRCWLAQLWPSRSGCWLMPRNSAGREISPRLDGNHGRQVKHSKKIFKKMSSQISKFKKEKLSIFLRNRNVIYFFWYARSSCCIGNLGKGISTAEVPVTSCCG